MSLFDGTKQPLAYADALVLIAVKQGWPSDEHQAEVVKAIQVEHGVYVVPQAETRAAELERLRALAAEKESVEKAAAEESEIAKLRVQLGLDPETGAPAAAPAAEVAPAQ